LTIPVKSTNHKSYPLTPQWWNSSCTEAVKTRSLHFKMFRRTGCLSDLQYRNVSAHTTRLLKNVKRNSWNSFCSNLNPSCSIQYLLATARRFENCVNPNKRLTMVTGSITFVLKSLRAMSPPNQKLVPDTTLS
jgi:hypothetical protein